MRHDDDDDDYDDDYDDYGGEDRGKHMSGLIAGFTASAIILVILLIAAVMQSGDGNDNNTGKISLAEASSTEDDTSVTTDESAMTGLRSQDLSFWDLTEAESTESASISGRSDNGIKDPSKTGQDIKSEKNDASKESTSVAVSDEDNPDKTEIVHSDGSTEYVSINKAIASNKYADTGFQTENGIMNYYSNGKSASYSGADISADNGDVDFKALKKAGISFVMIKLGGRGYSSGKVVLDGNYTENIKAAADAGLNIGISFDSQAVNETEAVEEVNFMLQNMAGYNITYPVAVNIRKIDNDTSRTDGLSSEERTKIAAAFMSSIRAAGFLPMLSGSKECLIKDINLPSLTDSKIWLIQPGDLPDYPYQFAMWQYSSKGKVSGIDGNADLDISMIDFSSR